MTSVNSTQSPRASFMICGLSVKYHCFRLLESIGLVFAHVHFFLIGTTIASVDGCAALSTSVNNNAYTARALTLFHLRTFRENSFSHHSPSRNLASLAQRCILCVIQTSRLFSTTIQTTQHNTAPTILAQPTRGKQPRSLHSADRSLTHVSLRK